MNPLDAFWHFVHLFLPALATAALAAAGAKVLWRRDLTGVRWRTLAGAGAIGGVAATAAGLMWTGGDGRMLTYAGIVLCTALMLWWQVYRAGRRRR